MTLADDEFMLMVVLLVAAVSGTVSIEHRRRQRSNDASFRTTAYTMTYCTAVITPIIVWPLDSQTVATSLALGYFIMLVFERVRDPRQQPFLSLCVSFILTVPVTGFVVLSRMAVEYTYQWCNKNVFTSLR